MKSIVFSAEMVQETLIGHWNTAKLLVDPQPRGNAALLRKYTLSGTSNDSAQLAYEFGDGTTVLAPYCSGDILYVQEPWRAIEASYPPGRTVIEYKAGGTESFDTVIALPTEKGEWKSPTNMSQKAARLFLQVTKVEMKRLQDIDEGAKAGDENPWVFVVEFKKIKRGDKESYNGHKHAERWQ